MSSLFIMLMVIQAIVAALLVAVILMQKSEGGGLGVGGSPAGLMSARGAADFLSRSTAILAIAFVVLSITLATLAVGASSSREIDDSLNRQITPAQLPAAPAPQPANPLSAVPAAPAGSAPVPAPAAPAPQP
jgi:preprotein translocase subunit SecG